MRQEADELAAAVAAFRAQGGDYPAFLVLVQTLLQQYASPDAVTDPSAAIFQQNADLVSTVETCVSLEQIFSVSFELADEDLLEVSIDDLARRCRVQGIPE